MKLELEPVKKLWLERSNILIFLHYSDPKDRVYRASGALHTTHDPDGPYGVPEWQYFSGMFASGKNTMWG